MIELTNLLEPDAVVMDDAFKLGALLARQQTAAGPMVLDASRLWGTVRARHGFQPIPTPLLTPPSANAKLDKSVVPAYGLTLQHYVTRINPALVVNACPNAGDCVKVCVLNNGNGMYPAVQRARKAKLEFLVERPEAFALLLGWELQKAAIKHGSILFRPNVNSDVAWERLLPSLVNGYIDGVVSYGYSKRPEVLDTDGWLGDAYRVAYSWNENSDAMKVGQFLLDGGSVAMVTSRKKGDDTIPPLGSGITPSAPVDAFDVIDADKTDEWIFIEGAIGDLSAKGKARSLIGKSGFVLTAV